MADEKRDGEDLSLEELVKKIEREAFWKIAALKSEKWQKDLKEKGLRKSLLGLALPTLIVVRVVG